MELISININKFTLKSIFNNYKIDQVSKIFLKMLIKSVEKTKQVKLI